MTPQAAALLHYYIIHNRKTLFKNTNMNNNTIHHLQG